MDRERSESTSAVFASENRHTGIGMILSEPSAPLRENSPHDALLYLTEYNSQSA